jgi:hypothetical protein
MNLAAVGMQLLHLATALGQEMEAAQRAQAQRVVVEVRRRVYESVTAWCWEYAGYVECSRHHDEMRVEVEEREERGEQQQRVQAPRQPGSLAPRRPRYSSIRHLLVFLLLALVALAAGTVNATPARQQGISGTFRSHF